MVERAANPTVARRSMSTVNVIGCGGIGSHVIKALSSGELTGWRLGAVLARSARTLEQPMSGVQVTEDADEFFAVEADLIIEAAGREALAAMGARSLAAADVWAVSGTALADDETRSEIATVAARTGNRFRLVPGAIAGLDGVSALTVAPDAQVHVHVDLVPQGDTASVVFAGSAREAADRFPAHVNVAAAAAIAGLGFDRTRVTVHQPKAGDPHTIRVEVSGRDGSLTATTHPVVVPNRGIHMVGSALVAALTAATKPIQVG